MSISVGGEELGIWILGMEIHGFGFDPECTGVVSKNNFWCRSRNVLDESVPYMNTRWWRVFFFDESVWRKLLLGWQRFDSNCCYGIILFELKILKLKKTCNATVSWTKRFSMELYRVLSAGSTSFALRLSWKRKRDARGRRWRHIDELVDRLPSLLPRQWLRIFWKPYWDAPMGNRLLWISSEGLEIMCQGRRSITRRLTPSIIPPSPPPKWVFNVFVSRE